MHSQVIFLSLTFSRFAWVAPGRWTAITLVSLSSSFPLHNMQKHSAILRHHLLIFVFHFIKAYCSSQSNTSRYKGGLYCSCWVSRCFTVHWCLIHCPALCDSEPPGFGSAAGVSISDECVFVKRHMHNRLLTPTHPAAATLSSNPPPPMSLPSAEISDAQSRLFATDSTDVTGTLNFKIPLKCKAEESQVAPLTSK